MTSSDSDAAWDIRLDGDPQLVLGRRQGQRDITAVAVGLHSDLFPALRAICDEFLRQIDETSPRAYEPNAEIDRDDQHFVLELDELPQQPESSRAERSRRQQRDGEGDGQGENPDRTAALVRTLRSPGQLEQIDSGSLKDFKALFYSIAYQQESGDWVNFIKKVNPMQLLKPGRMWTQYGTALRKIDSPDMAIEANVDVVLTSNFLVSFSGVVIKNLFTDVHLAFRDVPNYVATIAASLGADMILTEEAQEALRVAARKKFSLVSRLHSLQRHLAEIEVKPDTVRSILAKHAIDGSQLLDSSDNFSFGEDGVGLFVDILEGRYFESDWNDEPRRADRYSTRR